MTWSPTSTDRLWVEGEVIQISNHLCTITNGMLPIMDTGTAAVPLAGFHPMGMNCNNFKLSMVRARDGVVAPDLAPGAIVTMQRREIISI